MTKQIELPWPHKDLHSNARLHHMAKARATKAARALAKAACLEKPRIEPDANAVILIECYPKTFRGDVHNMPTALKAYIDGVADAMNVDDKAFKVDYPSVWAGRSDPPKVVFRIMSGTVEVPIVGTAYPDCVVFRSE